jgi:hypothetical protein
MRRFWRDLERLARLVHLGLLPLHGHRCVYRKPKPGRNGDEVRPESRVN